MKKETNFTFLFDSFLLYFIFYCYRSSSKENEMLYYLPWIINISSHLEVFCKKSVLKNVAKFPGKHLCQSLFFYTVPELKLKLFKRRNSLTGFFLWIIYTPFVGCFRPFSNVFMREKKSNHSKNLFQHGGILKKKIFETQGFESKM